MSEPEDVCPSCRYPKSSKGCETPGCTASIWMTEEVRQRRARRAEADAERERINAIRGRVLDQAISSAKENDRQGESCGESANEEHTASVDELGLAAWENEGGN